MNSVICEKKKGGGGLYDRSVTFLISANECIKTLIKKPNYVHMKVMET